MWPLCCCVRRTKEKESKTVRKRTSDRETQRIESKNKTTKKSQLENILISLNLCVHACDSIQNSMNSIHLFYCHHKLGVCVCAFYCFVQQQINNTHIFLTSIKIIFTGDAIKNLNSHILLVCTQNKSRLLPVMEREKRNQIERNDTQ